jgi:4-amino-4-deoxy-L-arabinose transferase-like glycosyltransferase
MKSDLKNKIGLPMVMAIGIIFRLAVWKTPSTMTWDEGAHSLAGVMLTRFISSGFDPSVIGQFISNYWATIGSLFFYPYGYDILSTLSFLTFGLSDLSARLPSMLFSVLLIHATYLLGSQILNKKIGLLAAFFAAINPTFIFWGGQAVVDLPMVCLMTYGAYFYFAGIESEKIIDFVLAGVFIGLAGMMKPPGFIIAPFFIFIIVYYKGYKYLWHKNTIAMLTAMMLFFVSYFGSGLIAKIILPNIGLVSQESGDAIFRDIYHWFGSAVTHFESIDPHWYSLTGWTYYPQMLILQMGWFLATAIAIIGGWILYNKNKTLFYPIVIYILFVYLLFTFLNNKDSRYVMSYLPFICVLAGAGLYYIKQRYSKAIGTVVIIVISGILITNSIYVLKQLQAFDPYNSELPQIIETIISRPPGLVIPLQENNEINVQTISFYMSIRDPQLQYSVLWPEAVSQAKYILTTENLTDAELIFNNSEINVFQK